MQTNLSHRELSIIHFSLWRFSYEIQNKSYADTENPIVLAFLADAMSLMNKIENLLKEVTNVNN